MADNPFNKAYSSYKANNQKFKGGSSTKFKSGTVVKSDVKGVNQVAISGSKDPSNVLIETKVTNEQPTLNQKTEPTPVAPTVQTVSTTITPGVNDPITQRLKANNQRVSVLPSVISKTSNDVRASTPSSNVYDRLKVASDKATYKAQTSSGWSTFGYQFESVGATTAAVVIQPFIKPVSFVKESAQGVWDVFTKPFEVGYAFKEQVINAPGQAAGQVLGGYILGKVPQGVKNTYVVAGSSYVPAEQVFAKEVLRGESKFPLTGSVTESLGEFNKKVDNKVVVQTSSPAKLSGDVAGVGKKAGLGLEDPGIYVTPKGRGSPAFTGLAVGQSTPEYTFTLNPFKGSTSIPTVTEFEVKSVVQYPRTVIAKPGFSEVGSYQENVLSKQAVAVITKRSEIGQGNIQPRKFDSPSGKILSEAGTSEIEAVIPKGSKFAYEPKTGIGKIKGFNQYTTLDGQPVAIRRAVVLEGEQAIAPNLKALSEKVISKDYASTSYVNKRVVSPSYIVSSIKPVSSNVSSVNNSSIVSESKMSSVASSGYSVGGKSGSVISYPSKPASSSVGSSIKNVSYKNSNISSNAKNSPVSQNSYSSISSSRPSSYTFTIDNPQSTNKKIELPFSKSKSDSSVFGVEVRSRGVFKTVGRGLNLKQAVALGKSRVGNSAAATFRITSNGQPIVVNQNFGKGFYTKGSNVVESRGFRIKSSGELQQITYQGIRSQRKRGAFI